MPAVAAIAGEATYPFLWQRARPSRPRHHLGWRPGLQQGLLVLAQGLAWVGGLGPVLGLVCLQGQVGPCKPKAAMLGLCQWAHQ